MAAISGNMRLRYGNYTFMPTPIISFATETKRSEAGYIINTVDKISLKGVLFADGSTPNSSATPKNQSSIYNLGLQLSGLTSAFSSGYQQLKLECVPPNNLGPSTIVYTSPASRTVIDNVSFENSTDNNWLQIIDYTIDLSVYHTGSINYIADSGYLVSNFVNTYSISTSEDKAIYYNNSNRPKQFQTYGADFPSYTITREISAQGIETKTRSAYDNAVLCVSGLISSSPLDFDRFLAAMSIYDRSSEISKDPINGTFSIRDTFVGYSGSSGWTDSFDVNVTVDNSLKQTVEVVGEVKGMLRYPSAPNTSDGHLYDSIVGNTFATGIGRDGYGGNQWAIASGGFYQNIAPNILNRARSAGIRNTGIYHAIISSGKYPFNTGLNPIPLSVSIDHNFNEGSIRYSYTYDSRPLNIISGAISESLDIDDSYALRTYSFPDLFFRLPIAQDHGTYNNSKRSITYSATFLRPLNPNSVNTSQINSLLEQFNPSGLALRAGNVSRGPRLFSWPVEQTESFDVMNGKYTKKITWEYQKGYI